MLERCLEYRWGWNDVMYLRRHMRYLFRIVIARHCGIVRIFRPTKGLVKFHFGSRAMRGRRRFYCTGCGTGFSMNSVLPHVKICNGSRFIEKNRREGWNPPPLCVRVLTDMDDFHFRDHEITPWRSSEVKGHCGFRIIDIKFRLATASNSWSISHSFAVTDV
jgi:hypothetical protein